jgi:hypothetical protein
LKIAKDKIAITMTLFLMFAMTLSLVAVPNAKAQDAPTRTTFPYIGAVPNPVGVGQEVLLHVGITQQLSNIVMGWESLSVTITRPDGTTETIRDLRTDSTGGTGTVIVPTMAGNYTLVGHFPEQVTAPGKTTPGSPTGTIMLASSTEPLTLVVQEEPITYFPDMPLPTEYWTRPIDAQLREWSVLAGSWLVATPDNKFVPYNEEAPETAHILWAKPIITGGLVGGEVDQHAFECGDAYQGKWSSRFIIAGMLISTHHTSVRPLEYTAIDLRTGQELWTTTFLDNRTISMAQLFYWDSYNYHGTYAYLWATVGTTWYAFDPFDTTHRITMENVPSGSTIVGDKGEIYRYSINVGQRTVMLWNMSARISWEGSFRGTGHNTYDAGGWTGTTTAQTRAYALNFTLPEGLSGSVQRVWLGDRIIGGSISLTEVRLWGVSLQPGDEGRLLFDRTWNAPASWEEGLVTVSGFGGGWMAWSQEDYVGVLWVKETREHYGFSLETGNYLWGPTEPQYYLDSVDDSGADVRNIAYGKLYSASVGGIVYCYDVQTGERLWTYEAYDPYSEILWANNWWLKPVFITDGKIYFGHTEHSPIDPKPRGAPFICLDAETGEEIWRANGLFRTTRWGGRAIIGDSIIATMDTYDQRIYAIGKGPSATTVNIQNDVTTHGKKVLVTGKVTDVSPGTNDISMAMRFPNGVPAVADESMSDWMLYVYKQFPRPADATGVEVVISVHDPNDNYYEVGTATADANGFFKLVFEPEVPGEYKVIATFEGSKAYYGSSSETAVFVDEAPAPTPEPTPPPESIADVYFVPAVIGIIVAIAVATIIIVLAFRKR